MKNLLAHIILVVLLSSCEQEKTLVGHWHEYKNLHHGFENCYIITDSTISINKSTKMGGTFPINTLEPKNIWIYSSHINDSIPSYKWKNDTIKFENGIVWVKQQENKETYLSDFSAGYKINIHPIESNGELLQPLDLHNGRISIVLALGKLKPEYENREKGMSSGDYVFQANDLLIEEPNDLIQYINCIHCQLEDIDLYVRMDKDTPYRQRKTMDSVITFLGLKPDQIFYQHLDLKKMKSGYKNISGY